MDKVLSPQIKDSYSLSVKTWINYLLLFKVDLVAFVLKYLFEPVMWQKSILSDFRKRKKGFVFLKAKLQTCSAARHIFQLLTLNPLPSDYMLHINVLGFGCSFDQDMCGFVQSAEDTFDWTRRSGGTSSGSTGPTADYSGTGQLKIY